MIKLLLYILNIWYRITYINIEQPFFFADDRGQREALAVKQLTDEEKHIPNIYEMFYLIIEHITLQQKLKLIFPLRLSLSLGLSLPVVTFTAKLWQSKLSI